MTPCVLNCSTLHRCERPQRFSMLFFLAFPHGGRTPPASSASVHCSHESSCHSLQLSSGRLERLPTPSIPPHANAASLRHAYTNRERAKTFLRPIATGAIVGKDTAREKRGKDHGANSAELNDCASRSGGRSHRCGSGKLGGARNPFATSRTLVEAPPASSPAPACSPASCKEGGDSWQSELGDGKRDLARRLPRSKAVAAAARSFVRICFPSHPVLPKRQSRLAPTR